MHHEHNANSANLPKNFPLLQFVPTKKNSQVIGKNWLINYNDRHSPEGENILIAGIIKNIFGVLPPGDKWMCEFGAHEPEYCSHSWRMIHNQGWNAVLIDAEQKFYDMLTEYYKDTNSVHCVLRKIQFEGKDTLDNILTETPIPENMDLMIIDIDGNDYHIWETINRYQAKVVMIEFIATIPLEVSFVQAKDFSINNGSSLAAMNNLAKQKGYKLVAVTSWNAFFVQEKYFDLFFKEEPTLEEIYVYPAKLPTWMHAFQLYDGTLVLGDKHIIWHNINLDLADIQVLPKSYRFFSRELAHSHYILELNGEKTAVTQENTSYLNKIFAMPSNKISAFACNTHSKYGEDGILEKLISMISVNHSYFVDVGAWDGVAYSKSKNLRDKHQWQGLLIESDDNACVKLRKNSSNFPKIKAHFQKLTLAGNSSLQTTLEIHSVPTDFDVLLLNNYGMEYHLWESLNKFNPKIVAVQFNPTIPNDMRFIQENNFSVHHGCSLRALYELAAHKGYELVGTTMETAFFVDKKYFPEIASSLGIESTDPDDMFCPVAMHLFQLFDGTLRLAGLTHLLWHCLRIDEDKMQVVPKALRKFHQYADSFFKKAYYRELLWDDVEEPVDELVSA